MSTKRSLVLAAAVAAVAFGVQPLTARADIAGFAGFDAVNKFLNGAPSANPNVGYSGDGASFHLTDPVNSQQTSGYHATPQTITSFTTSFNYHSIPNLFNGGPNVVAANGIAFNLINAPTGTATLTNVGDADSMGIRGVTNSTGLQFNNFGGFLNYPGSVRTYAGGDIPGPTDRARFRQLPSPGLSSGSVHSVAATYSNGILRYTITDSGNGKTFKFAENVDIAAAVGGATALVGFSGSTGGFNSDQTVSNFQFTSGTGSAYTRRIVSPTAVFTPIALSGGFNQTVVVPKVASLDPNVGDAIGYITATPDNGTNVSVGTSGATYYENGLGSTAAGSGLPTSGAVFTSQADGRHTFKMPTYNTNAFSNQTPDSLTLYSPIRDVAAVGDTTGELSFEAPTAYTSLSLLMAAGNGPADIAVTVRYADGTTLDLGDAIAPDWFNRPSPAWNAQGRVDPATLRVDVGAFGLHQADLALPISPVAISSIELSLQGASDTRSVATIFGVSGVASSVWALPTGGDWEAAASWVNGTPDGVDAVANFGKSILSNSTVNLASDKTVGAMAFENSAGYTLGGAGTLTVDVTSGTAPIFTIVGSHTIDVPVALADSAAVSTYNGSSIAFAKPVALSAGSTLTTSGSVAINGTITGGAGSTLAVSTGTTSFGATQRLAGLSIAAGAKALMSDGPTGTILRAESLSIAATGKLDLADNAMVIDYSSTSPLADVREKIVAGFNAAGAAWTGNGIISSAALADPRYAIGYAEASTIVNPFTGEALDGTAVVVRVTLRGDANLSGGVNFADLVLLAQNYNRPDTSWLQGDFNYDATTNFADLVALAQNYNQSLPAGAAAQLGDAFVADFALAQALVPEPTTMLAALPAALCLMRRRPPR